ncbi:esterase [Candidatus Pelagibacter bacterium]|nr:esterase [Candidatus Pelagibacter bacterium]
MKNFIQERSAHVTQTTLYGYLKTRMGHKFTLMVQDEVFSKSINLAKWNIYMVALADCTFFTFSFLITEKNLQKKNFKEVFLEIIDNEKNNGLSEEIYIKAKEEFNKRAETVDFKKYYLEEPFKESGLALFNWSPIADELKELDKKIVLNSIKLKWNLVTEEFKRLTTNLKFN